MKLKQLQLRDFQAHKVRKLDLSPGITTIVGPTDVGKSAILRALRWVCLNDLGGSEFVRDGAKETEVKLLVRKGKSEALVTRSKSAKGPGNLYALNDQEFRAFGIGVPPDVADCLRLDALNFQAQHDAPFWFSKTAGEVSRELNSIVDLSIIDVALAYIAAEVRRSAERESLVGEGLATARQDLRALVPQKERITEFAALQTQDQEVQKIRQQNEGLSALVQKYEQDRKLEAQKLVQYADGVELLAKMKQARKLIRQVEDLGEALAHIGRLREAAVPPPDFSQVVTQHLAFSTLDNQVELLNQFIRQFDLVQSTTLLTQAALREADKRFHTQTKGKTCPMCGNLM